MNRPRDPDHRFVTKRTCRVLLSGLLLTAFGLTNAACATPQGSPAERTENPAKQELDEPTIEQSTIEVRGRWVLDQAGKAIGPEDFRRGLQPSGLAFYKGELLCLGDQRSQFPGHLLRIDPRTGELKTKPSPFGIDEPSAGENPHYAGYRALPNADFEGIAVDPSDPQRLFAVTEDKTPWLVTLRMNEEGKASITHMTSVDLSSISPWRDDTNFRIEGLTLSPDGKRILLAYERAKDDFPRLLEVSTAAALAKTKIQPKLFEIDFSTVPRRADKARARLNINGIQYLQVGRRQLVLAIARDQERLLIVDLEAGRVARIVDLNLRSPQGETMLWVSPEAITVDQKSNRVWFINDPDSVRGNYRLLESESAQGRFAEYAPQLFELRLSQVLGAKLAPGGTETR